MMWEVYRPWDFTFCTVHVSGVPKIRWVSVIRNVTYSLTYVYLYVTQWFNHLCIIPCFLVFSKVVAIFSKSCPTCLEDFTFCVIHVFSADITSCETCTGWEILHFVLFMYVQLTKDHVWREQVGRFYILYYLCIFSKIMRDRLGNVHGYISIAREFQRWGGLVLSGMLHIA
jgi:hypothetical protein